MLVPQANQKTYDGKPPRSVTFEPLGDPVYFGVEPGTEAIVVSDDDPKDGEYRKVTVRLKEGSSRDRTGTVNRGDLRPAK